MGKKKRYRPRTAPLHEPAAESFAAKQPVPAGRRWSAGERRRFMQLAVLLVVVTAAVFAQVRSFDFVNFDDDVYVTDNPIVQEGLNRHTVAWAFTSGHGSNWHPLVWLSLMLNVETTGMNPAGFHLTNVGLHVLNALLLFYFLARTTTRIGPSALVAALFALHPLHVESVAWVTERKDVLSTFFMLLTLIAYARYARAPAGRGFAWVGAALALALMSKPMAVTIPCLLLLLDYWPLGRYAGAEGGRFVSLLREKLPLFGLVLLSSVITFLVQQHGGAVGSLEVFSPAARLSNAVFSYAAYLYKMVWPVHLAFFYPHPRAGLPAAPVLLAACLLAGLTFLALWQARRRPYLAVGWFWYLGMLVPVIGLVQVGEQSMADRYTYLPAVGVFMALTWWLADLVRDQPVARNVLAGLAVLWLALLAGLTWRQTATWENDITLCQHALDVTKGNYKAHNNLGIIYERLGRDDEALQHYQQALDIRPNHERYFNLGNAYRRRGDVDAAVRLYHEALKERPEYPRALNNLGAISVERNDLAAALDFFQRAADAQPKSPEYRTNLGVVEQRQGHAAAAAEHYRQALRLDPNYTRARDNLARLSP